MCVCVFSVCVFLCVCLHACLCVCIRYDLYDVDIVIHDSYTGLDGSINYAPSNSHFVKLSLGEMLCEGHVHIRYCISQFT